MEKDCQHSFDKVRYLFPSSLPFDSHHEQRGFTLNSHRLCKIKNVLYIPLFIFLVFFSSCNRNPLKVDISGIDTEIEVVRFDQELFGLPLQDTLSEFSRLRNRHPGFFDLFTWKVIGVGGIEEEHFTDIMGEFLTDTMILDVKRKVNKEFSDFEDIRKDLITAFKYYQYHFPNKKLPTIYTTISGFNQSVFTAENIIGVSLDKYLGRDCSYYKQLSNVPMYKIKNMHPGKLVPDVVYAWGMTDFDELKETTTLLDNIVHQGKLMYFTDALLPEMHDTLKIGYTGKQLTWCENNEPQMWNYLIERKLLYSNKRMDVIRYINDGPTTTGFPRESPGRTGTWLGWQIVRQYMEKNKAISLVELMGDTNYQEILNQSDYYPQ